MQRLTHRRILSLLLGFPIACGSNADPGDDSASGRNGNDGFISNGDGTNDALDPGGGTTTLKAAPFTFPGAGTSRGAERLVAGLGPETAGECNPEAVAGSSAAIDDVQTFCFFDESESGVPSAAIEQVVEVIGTEEWVHIRLTLNPDFVDNTFGDHAIGWGDIGDNAGGPAPTGEQPPVPGEEPPAPSADAGAPVPPENAPPPPDGEEPPVPPDGEEPPVVADAGAPVPPPPGERPPRGGPRGPGAEPGGPGGPGGSGRDGHTFKDLVGSDHAEMQLLDGAGNVIIQFKLDYISESSAAASGFESLGVSGGEGKLIAGDESDILAFATSLDRNLEGCGLSDFTVDSPATDEIYTPNPDALDWDYRVSYEVWVAADAFGEAGFGSALIELVHASPSKLQSDSVDVRPAPCPVDPTTPELEGEPLPSVLSNLR
jgi:hypothetical protein